MKKEQTTLGIVVEKYPETTEEVDCPDREYQPQTGQSNKGSRTGVYLSRGVKQDKSAYQNQMQARVEKEEIMEDEKSYKCWRFNCTKKKIAILIVCVILALTAIIVPLVVVFCPRGTVDNNQSIYPVPVTFKGKTLTILSQSVPAENNIDNTLLNSVGGQTDATDLFTEITARCSLVKEESSTQCNVIVPLLSILGTNDWNDLEEAKNDWLVQYNKNPRAFIDKFVRSINQILQAQNAKDQSKIIIDSVEEELLIDVKHNSQKEIFEIAKYESSGSEPDQQPKKESAANAVSSDDGTWVDGLLEKTSQKLKDILLINLNAIKARSKDFAIQQEKFAKDEKIEGDWQDVLVNKCRTINEGLFRCALDSVNKLVPEFDGQNNGEKAPADSILTYAIELKVRQVAV